LTILPFAQAWSNNGLTSRAAQRRHPRKRSKLMSISGRRALIVTVTLLIIAAGPAARAQHIDTFDYGDFTWNAAPGETATFTPNETVDMPGILGGKRTVTITNDADSAQEINVRLIVDDLDFKPSEVPLTFDLGGLGGQASGSLELSYDTFEERDFINIPSADATWDRIVIDFEAAGSTPGGTVAVTLTSGDGESATVSKPALSPSVGQLAFPYADFLAANPAFTTGSLLDVTGARLRIDAVEGNEYRLEFFGRGGFVPNDTTVIPLPSALLAMPAMMAVAGAAYRRMRRRA
jgi:hypothetical protein